MDNSYKKNINGIEYIVPIINRKSIDLDYKMIVDKKIREIEYCILDVGQDQLTHKAYYLSKELEKKGVKTVFFAADKTGLSDENIIKDKLVAKKIVFNPFKNAINYIRLIKKYKPIHIELYLDVMPWDLMFFVFYAKLKKIPIVSRCRGGEILNWTQHRKILRIAYRYTLRRSNIILIRELYMVDHIVKYNICSMKNVNFFHNHTPVPNEYNKLPTNIILYLNSLKAFRNPYMMIDIALELRKREMDFKFVVVGFTKGYMTAFDANIEETKFITSIKKEKLESYFELHNFSNKTYEYFLDASIFILPTDMVFVNHSLIEAMAYQNVPIIQKSNGGNLIIENEISGFMVEMDHMKYADKIEYLLKNKDVLREMGLNARKKILADFDSSKQAEKILEFYAKNLWDI
ncbi:hypothetical protein BK011_02365 [Tenericutes bacterium MZ-XQ]|nr:hypothetical protein BK011_02365 [Tenericutes bacterium MZ-XQ]